MSQTPQTLQPATPSHFIVPYMQFVGTHITDGPYSFQETGALAILSTLAMGKRWIPKGSGIRPNAYFLLTAHSTGDRKTAAVDAAFEIIHAVAPERVGPSDFTPEGIYKVLAKRPNTILKFREFGRFVQIIKKNYNTDISGTLTDLYDGSREGIERVRIKGDLKIENPHLSFLGAVTYAHLSQFMDPIEWETGFLSRIHFVTPQLSPYFAGDRPTPLSPQPDRVPGDIRPLVNRLHEMLRYMGDERPYTTHPSAVDYFRQWEQQALPVESLENTIAIAQRGRFIQAVWKLAQVYQIDIDCTRLEISVEAVWRAILYTQACWESFKAVYAMTSTDKDSKYMQQMLKTIRTNALDGTTTRDLYREAHIPMSKAWDLLQLLAKMNAVVRLRRGRTDYWFPGENWEVE